MAKRKDSFTLHRYDIGTKYFCKHLFSATIQIPYLQPLKHGFEPVAYEFKVRSLIWILIPTFIHAFLDVVFTGQYCYIWTERFQGVVMLNVFHNLCNKKSRKELDASRTAVGVFCMVKRGIYREMENLYRVVMLNA